MAFVGFEGSANHVTYEKGLIGKIVHANGGLVLIPIILVPVP